MNDTKAFNFKRAVIWFLIAYFIVSVLATATSVIYEMVCDLPPAAPGQSILEAPAFADTVAYHVLIMLVVWPLFAHVYFRKPAQPKSGALRETWRLAVCWLLLAIVVDFIGFVLMKHPWTLTPYEFYVVYQPWISLIYLSIFASPFIRLALVKRGG